MRSLQGRGESFLEGRRFIERLSVAGPPRGGFPQDFKRSAFWVGVNGGSQEGGKRVRRRRDSAEKRRGCPKELNEKQKIYAFFKKPGDHNIARVPKGKHRENERRGNVICRKREKQGGETVNLGLKGTKTNN